MYSRSEGLAVASLEMFKTGLFSSDPTEPCQVDGAGLKKVTVEALARGMQHSEQNPLAGLEGRAGLLVRLSEALNNQELFGVDARPGNMLGMGSPEKSSIVEKLNNGADTLFLPSRLPPFASHYTCLISSHCVSAHIMVSAHGRISRHLAIFTNANRWRFYW